MNVTEVKSKEEAIEWIHALKTLGIKPGLKRMEWMLERLNHPERRVKFVHIAGTNGKGSTLSYIAQVLKKSGYQVGTFTSPYLIDFTNRIQVNGKDISGDDLVNMLNQIIPLAKELEESELGAPTEFEIITSIAFLYYATVAYPDIVLLETGLGGRLDSTNVIIPLISVITNIGHDHMDLLGNDIKDIAAEKAGIIKSGIPVISGIENEEAIRVIKDNAASKKASVYQINEQFSVNPHNINHRESIFDFKDPFFTMPEMTIHMIGPHQVKNAAVALMTLEVLRQFYAFYIDEDAFYSGMKNTFWAGRFEVLSEKPLLIIDGAHNPEAAKSLSETISLLTYNRLIMVTGILKDKEIEAFYRPLIPLADELIITQPENPRAASIQEMVSAIHAIQPNKQVKAIEDWREAIQQAMQVATKDDVILFTGSLYMISDVRHDVLKELKA